jgi:hypothetical protein
VLHESLPCHAGTTSHGMEAYTRPSLGCRILSRKAGNGRHRGIHEAHRVLSALHCSFPRRQHEVSNASH